MVKGIKDNPKRLATLTVGHVVVPEVLEAVIASRLGEDLLNNVTDALSFPTKLILAVEQKVVPISRMRSTEMVLRFAIGISNPVSQTLMSKPRSST